jgi:hypothetical protein
MYKTIIVPVVLYGCETWSLTLREEHRLRVIENRVPRRKFGPKWDEVKGKERKLHNGENEVDGACGTHGKGEKVVQGFGGKSRGKKTTWKTKDEMGGCDQNGP